MTEPTNQERGELHALQVPPEIREIASDLTEFRPKPATTGFVYFLIQNDVVVYVGQTINLPARIVTHRGDKKRFDRVLYMELEVENMLFVERYWIERLKPILNGDPSAQYCGPKASRRRKLKSVS